MPAIGFAIIVVNDKVNFFDLQGAGVIGMCVQAWCILIVKRRGKRKGV